MQVDAKPVSCEELVSWRSFWRQVRTMSLDQLEARTFELRRLQTDVGSPLLRNTDNRLQQAKHDGDLREELVLSFLKEGELKAYALRPNTDSAFEIPSAWWHAAGSLHDIVRSISTGTFAIDGTNFEEKGAEREIANRPILLSKIDAVRFLATRPPSDEQIRQCSETLQTELIARDGRRPTKDLFVRTVSERHPTWPKKAALDAWNTTPAEWHRKGRRKLAENR